MKIMFVKCSLKVESVYKSNEVAFDLLVSVV